LKISANKAGSCLVDVITLSRVLAVEYKRAHLISAADSQEMIAIGKLWERYSGGKGLFIVVKNVDDKGRNVRAKIIGKLSGGN
jgi:hypothetical protein